MEMNVVVHMMKSVIVGDSFIRARWCVEVGRSMIILIIIKLHEAADVVSREDPPVSRPLVV